ncbi:MAG: hypothetical protein IK031_04380 [Bacteroidales bacterium]|nr:hypothetical protein [Bacteroidales bacterium]
MKANYVILAALGVFAMTAVSCKIDNSYDLSKTEAAVEVPIEQEPVEVPSDDLMDFNSSEAVEEDSEGNLQITVMAEGSATITANLKEGVAIEIPGELEMTTSKEDIPDFCAAESGAVFSDARLILDFSNPSPTPVVFKGKVSSGNKKAQMPDLVVPANKTSYKIALETRHNENLRYEEEYTANDYIVINESVAEVINRISAEDPIVVSDLTVELMNTRAAAPAEEEEYEFSVGALLHVPLWFPAGTVIKYDIDYSGELIDVSKYNVTVNDYQIVADVTNTIPFEISGYGTSTNGVRADLDTPVKPGDIDNPVKTHVLIHIKSSAEVLNLEGAVLHVTMKTDKDVRINKNQKLDIDMKSIKFSKQ